MIIVPDWIRSSAVSAWLFMLLLTACGGEGFRATSGPEVTSCCLYSSGGGGGGGSSAPRTGLLDNSGFEDGLNGWEDWRNSQLLTGMSHTGGGALRINSGGGRGQEIIYRVKTGASYKLSAFARVNAMGDSAALGIKFFDNNNVLMSENSIKVTASTWTQYFVQFKIPPSVSSAKIFFYKPNTATSPADADDFALVQVGAPVNPPMLPPIANPSGVQPLGLGSGWSLVMQDEFTTNTLNSSVWNTGFWFNYTINNELQAYRSENLRLNSGNVTLLAENRATSTTWGESKAYASGAITTRGKFKFTFGVVEARLKVPRGKGFRPQFWLLPDGKRAPPQIDVLDMTGDDPTYMRFNYKWMDENGIPHAQPGGAGRGDLAASYHTFALEWMPDHISFFVDGVLLGTYRGDYVLRDPAFLILNLVVGGDTAGQPDPSTAFPQGMDVDYVRVWQKP